MVGFVLSDEKKRAAFLMRSTVLSSQF